MISRNNSSLEAIRNSGRRGNWYRVNDILCYYDNLPAGKTFTVSEMCRSLRMPRSSAWHTISRYTALNELFSANAKKEGRKNIYCKPADRTPAATKVVSGAKLTLNDIRKGNTHDAIARTFLSWYDRLPAGTTFTSRDVSNSTHVDMCQIWTMRNRVPCLHKMLRDIHVKGTLTYQKPAPVKTAPAPVPAVPANKVSVPELLNACERTLLMIQQMLRTITTPRNNLN